MAKATITANERLQLIGLLALATKHNAQMKQIVSAAESLTGDVEMGHTGDACYCDYDADDLLSRLNIRVESPPAVDAVDPVGEKVTG